ncbi:MAG: dTDP-4-dehydrorhamnose 3,5-epimerase [Prevotella sp.]|nr:dTDP-4-dehydrorhamnose 3,5-epimerase [Bacteroidales bacterium]MDD6744724.1 dTDP-4-dehydrorhamnose 3,5-epimerase [Bacteroidales bacterium]MDY3842218.1 dTDP-4-dehydrorhamnose 3,5-epimerase [Prevotella sp.]
MEYITTEIEGVYIIQPRVFDDSRGYFFESWKRDEFEAHVGKVDFVQDNESKSSYGVLRGLHYQRGEHAQAKLVRVISGRVLDVAVDLRKSSPTFGRHVMVELSGDNKRQLFIPRGFAHGFLVLSQEAVFAYKVDNVYAPQAEASIRWDDETVGISWPIDAKDVVTSEKDLKGSRWQDAVFFE